MVRQNAEGLLEPFLDAARDLVKNGVDGITTNCGDPVPSGAVRRCRRPRSVVKPFASALGATILPQESGSESLPSQPQR